MDLLGSPMKINGAQALVQHGGVGNQTFVLLFSRHRTGLEPGQGLAEKSGTQKGQTVQHLPGGLVLPDGGGDPVDHISGIHLPAQVHGGDTGLLLPVQHRPLIGSGAPVLGEQACVNVNAPEGGHVQYLLREDPAVGYHGADIRLQGPEGLHRLLLPEIFRLEDRDPRFQSHFLYRAGGQLHTPALGPVRLGIGPYHLEAVCQDPFQAGGRNVRSAHKDNTHGHPSSLCSLISSSVRYRSMISVYTMPSRWSSSWQKHRAISSSPSTSNSLPSRS